jgi:hypothetical protein
MDMVSSRSCPAIALQLVRQRLQCWETVDGGGFVLQFGVPEVTLPQPVNRG